jgi:hypothetical protein
LKFCREHQYGELGLENLAACVASLEADDFPSALKHFRAINLGKDGLSDWFPPVVYEHEDGDYVWVVLEALVERSHRLMRMAAGDPDPVKKSK